MGERDLATIQIELNAVNKAINLYPAFIESIGSKQYAIDAAISLSGEVESEMLLAYDGEKAKDINIMKIGMDLLNISQKIKSIESQAEIQLNTLIRKRDDLQNEFNRRVNEEGE